MSRVKILNIEVDNYTMDEVIDRIDELVEKRVPSYVVTPNVDHMVTLERDARFREVYRDAALVLTDGKPLMWIARMKKTPIVEKVSGSDLFPRICELAALRGYSIYILGAAEGVADQAAINLKKKYPGLSVCGTYSPPMGFERDMQEKRRVTQRIKEAKPDILIVALGAPKGEKFIYRYYKELKVPVSLQLGASVDFEAGNIKRAPRWMSNVGLEWLYRTIQEPGRLAKRYLYDAVMLAGLLWKYR